MNVCVWLFFLLLRSYERNERRRVANSNRKFRWERTGLNPVPYRLNLLLINIYFFWIPESVSFDLASSMDKAASVYVKCVCICSVIC